MRIKVNPDKYYFYHHLKLIQPLPTPYPDPPVPPLLPLRPKTCIPKLEKAKEIEVKDLFSEEVTTTTTTTTINIIIKMLLLIMIKRKQDE